MCSCSDPPCLTAAGEEKEKEEGRCGECSLKKSWLKATVASCSSLSSPAVHIEYSTHKKTCKSCILTSWINDDFSHRIVGVLTRKGKVLVHAARRVFCRLTVDFRRHWSCQKYNTSLSSQLKRLKSTFQTHIAVTPEELYRRTFANVPISALMQPSCHTNYTSLWKRPFKQFQFLKQDRKQKKHSPTSAQLNSRGTQTCSHVIGPLNDIIAEKLGQRGRRAGELACRVDTMAGRSNMAAQLISAQVGWKHLVQQKHSAILHHL